MMILILMKIKGRLVVVGVTLDREYCQLMTQPKIFSRDSDLTTSIVRLYVRPSVCDQNP